MNRLIRMNNGLLRKAARESLAITIVIGLGLCGIELLFARILPAFYSDARYDSSHPLYIMHYRQT